MKLITASAAISFAKELEDESVRFYENLIGHYPEIEERSRSFIAENKKHKTSIDRAYYGVISDALEGCFSFEDIDTEDFILDVELADGVSYAEVLNKGITMEEKIMAFYASAAVASKSLMADVPRIFEKIAKKRGERIQELRSYLARD